MHPITVKWLPCIALAALGCRPALAQELQPIYVPIISATTVRTLASGGEVVVTQRWESTMSAFNPTDSPVSVVDAAVYGKGAVLTQVPRPPIQPHQGQGFVASVEPIPERGVGFLELRVSPGVVFYADVQNVTYRCAARDSYCDEIVHGQVNIPFYRALFPAGSVAVSGAVELGYFDLPKATYPPEARRLRRLNVTLFNAGAAPATFIVRTFPHNRSATPLAEQTLVVEPKDVFQINGLPAPTEFSIPLQSASGGSRIWVTITADQPFLSYVSTIFNAVEPGDLPFQVYPSYLQN